MKKDITPPPVEGVTIAIARTPKELDPSNYDWHVYLINYNDFPLKQVIVVSKGYGGETQPDIRTATLRHFYEEVEDLSFVKIEMIQEETFALVNEFWITYYVEGSEQIFDRKFVFLPETIREEELTHVPFVELEGIIHS